MRTLKTIMDDMLEHRIQPQVAMEEARGNLKDLPDEEAFQQIGDLIEGLDGAFAPIIQKIKERRADSLMVAPENVATILDDPRFWGQFEPFKGFAAYTARPRYTGALAAVVKGYWDGPPIYRWNHPDLSVYVPIADVIYMIDRHRAYNMSRETFEATVLHEMIHSTGNIKRLNRPSVAKGQKGIGINMRENHFEEIIADLGLMILGEETGILTAESKRAFDGKMLLFADGFHKYEHRTIESVRAEALPYAKAAAEYILKRPLTIRLAKFVRGYVKEAA